ncbi:MAG: ATP-grasp domain-containing protein [Phenylobacterium sp.]|uniref:D-alanine--D-alanine ligase family protein n=1 Tax=Phenylobacterium sp. TaxID=1871053 RepID=UPI00391DF9BF
MRRTILFGGVNRERLVSVASAQALSAALPEAELWYWAPGGQVHAADAAALAAHQRPFEIDFPATGAPIGSIEAALDRAAAERRVLVLALHGGAAENGDLGVLCEVRGVAFTGSGAAASRLAFDKAATKAAVAEAGVKAPGTVSVETAAEGLARYGRLVAKPVAEGSSYGLIFVSSAADLETLAKAAEREAYLVEPFIAGAEATCGVLERADGSLVALPPVEIRPAEGAFDYKSKYLAAATQEICPATFAPPINAALQDAALKAHRAVGARGYSRSDFIVTGDGVVFLEINTLPGLTKASLYPKALAAQGIEFVDFLEGQIALAQARAAETP